MKQITLFFSAFMLIVATTFAETNTWYIGYPNAEDVVATLGEDGTLTISGTGAIQDYNSQTESIFNLSPFADMYFPSVVIEEGITQIGKYLLPHASSISIPSTVYSISTYAFAGAIGVSPKRVILQDGRTNIPNSLFSSNVLINSIDIPNTVTSIAEVAFAGCTNLVSINLPKGLTTIGVEAFSGCHTLTSIIIPEGITRIEEGTFYFCESLVSISIPSTVTSIGGNAFMHGIGVGRTTDIYVHTSTPPVCETIYRYDHVYDYGVFNNNKPEMSYLQYFIANTTLHVPIGSKAAYQGAEQWEDFTNIVDDIIPTEIQSNTITWQSVPEAQTYTIVIYSDAALTQEIYRITLNASGSVLSVQGINTQSYDIHSNTLSYTCQGLENGKTYYYSLTAQKGDEIIGLSNGSFKTSQTNAVKTITADNAKIMGYYSTLGQKLPQEPESGCYIILYDNGKTEKIMKR